MKHDAWCDRMCDCGLRNLDLSDDDIQELRDLLQWCERYALGEQDWTLRDRCAELRTKLGASK